MAARKPAAKAAYHLVKPAVVPADAGEVISPVLPLHAAARWRPHRRYVADVNVVGQRTSYLGMDSPMTDVDPETNARAFLSANAAELGIAADTSDLALVEVQ